MDNLIALDANRLPIDDGAAGIQCLAVDALRNAVYATLNDKRIVGTDIKTKKALFSLDVPTSSDILGIYCMQELDAVVVTCTDGTLLLFNLDEQSFEPVGDLEGGILCSSASPDGELLLCITATGTMIVFNSEWDVLVEKEYGEGERTEGYRPTVAWCADGLKFALLNQSNGKSVVSVFDRNCVLEAKSEGFDGVGSALAFSPDGALIATSQQHSQRHDIIFFEPNALRHYEFTLPEHSAQSTVSALQWNADGSLLSLSLHDAKRGSGAVDAVQIWRRSNYHWYLKQEVAADIPAGAAGPRSCASCAWDESDPLAAVISVGGAAVERWTFDMAYSISVPELGGPSSAGSSGGAAAAAQDLCVVAAVDGEWLRLTPLGKMLVPPPMCAASVRFPAAINAVAWGPAGVLAVLTSDGGLHVCEAPFAKAAEAGWEAAPRVEASYKLRERGRGLFQVAWVDRRVLVAVEGGGAQMVTVVLPEAAGEGTGGGEVAVLGGSAGCASPAGLPQGLRRVVRESGSGECVAQTEDGSVFVVAAEGRGGAARTVSARRVGKLQAPCRWLALLPGGVVVGQTRRLKLLLEEEVVMEGALSCCVHDSFMLVTSTASKLLIFPLSGAAGRAEAWRAEEDGRFLERGTALVGAARGGHRVVMAMPRGNLEAVTPRTLVLHTVCAMLDAGALEAALRLMRAQKVDMNLAHDHHPAAFLAALPSLVRAASPHLLSLLISALRPDDVTVSTYPNAPPPAAGRGAPAAAAGSRKVDAVCDAMLAALEQVDGPKLLACKVLTFVRREPPRVEEAVRSLQGQEQGVQEDGLEVLMGLVDSKIVFDAALGLYDLELAAVAAQVGGQDPREYVPLLERLSALPDRICCYEVDLQLKRYASAVRHAVAAGPEEWGRAWGLVEAHGLYSAAVQALEGEAGRGEHLRQALRGLGADLVAKGRPKEGGLALLGGGDVKGASGALVQGGEWEAAFALLVEAGEGKEELERAGYAAAEAMREAGDGRGAARVYVEYCNDVEEAVMALCEARGWVEAGRVARSHRRGDLVPTCVAPSLEEAAAACGEDVARREEALGKAVERLAEIGREKAAKEAEEQRRRDEGEEEGGGDVGDDRSERSVANQSQASSVHTKSTRSSRSAKSSKSSKSNKTRSSARVPKPGDPWEEEYLVAQRAALLPSDAYKRDYGRVVEALVLFQQRAQAGELQRRLRRLEDWIAHRGLQAHLPAPPPPPDLVWQTVSLS